jgi:hypothetical protein
VSVLVRDWVTSLGAGRKVELCSLYSFSSLLRKGQVPHRLLGACLLMGVQVCSWHADFSQTMLAPLAAWCTVGAWGSPEGLHFCRLHVDGESRGGGISGHSLASPSPFRILHPPS